MINYSSTDQFKDQLNKFLKTNKQEIIKSLLDSNLTGRGGAGFPTGMKWDFCSKAKGDKKYVLCNADEGDSGAFSDRYLIRRSTTESYLWNGPYVEW